MRALQRSAWPVGASSLPELRAPTLPGVLAALGLAACAGAGGDRGATVEVRADCEELRAQKTIQRRAALDVGQSLVVSLCSNPTTGHRWTEQAVISEPSVLRQAEQRFVAPPAPPSGGPTRAGAPGRHEWTFEPLAQGSTHVRFAYRQPWMKEQGPAWSVDLEVRVADDLTP